MTQHKIAALQVKAAGPNDGLEEGQFTAYASTFDVKDSYGDVVVKGAFQDTLSEWDAKGDPIPVLWGHNMSDPDYNIGAVLEAHEDEHGLFVKAQLDLEAPKATQVYRLIKGRRVSQMSFAYDVLAGAPKQSDEFGDYFELSKVKLYEVSIVPIGANQETELLAVKARELAEGVKAGRTLSAKNETALREARDAIDAVLSSLGEDDTQKNQEPKATAPKPVKDEEPVQAKSDEPAPVTPAIARLERELLIRAMENYS